MEVAPHLIRYGDIEPANFFALAEKLIKVFNDTTNGVIKYIDEGMTNFSLGHYYSSYSIFPAVLLLSVLGENPA